VEDQPAWRPAALVAALAVASHATALSGGYVWLDHAHIEEGLALAAPSAWPSLFLQGFAGTGYYRPLMALSLSVDAAISRTPAFFHGVTLGWHAAAAFMTVVAARALGLSARAALIAGALFAVHPVSSVVASAIAFRSEAMTLFFLLCLVLAHLRQRPILSALALAAGALTKETGWVLGPLFVAALELDRRRRGASEPVRAGLRGRLFGAEAAALVISTGLRASFAPAFRASQPPLSVDEHVGTRLAALGKSALAIAIPVRSSVCDAFPVTPVVSLPALFGAVVLGGAALVALRGRACASLFALSLVPSLQIVPVMRWWSPHYLYVPLAFGAMLLAGVIEPRLQGPRLKIGAAGVAVALALLSLREGRRYATDVTLWSPEVRRDPTCREGHYFLGEVAQQGRAWETAARHYEQAAAPVPGVLAYADEAAALQNLGGVRFEQGRWAEARAAWEALVERPIEPGRKRRVTHRLALAALRAGDPGAAARLLESEMNADDPAPEALLLRARALHELGREDEARATLRRLPSSSGPTDP
jgi:protein O-mannosyl-transferase